MGFFDSPAIAIRKRIPDAAKSQFNAVEVFAENHLRYEPDQRRPYQLGIVFAAWVKAGIIAGEIGLSDRDARKIQAISDSCVKVIRNESFAAFRILSLLAKEDGIFGMPSEVFDRISFDAASYR